MSEINIKSRLKLRKDTEANWEKSNPILLNGEMIIIDTASGETKIKIGDGTTPYTKLPFVDGTNSASSTNNFMTKENPTGTGLFSLNAADLLSEDLGEYSFTEGYLSHASGSRSHAEGYQTHAKNHSSHSEGGFTIASGAGSHAEGWQTKASGGYSHAEGSQTEASGIEAHAEGSNTVAKGNASHAGGQNTIAAGNAQTVIGKFNLQDNDEKYSFIIGGGNIDYRKNIFTVDWKGAVATGGVVAAADPTDSSHLTTKRYVDKKLEEIKESTVENSKNTVQSDWEETDTLSSAYIKNKPFGGNGIVTVGLKSNNIAGRDVATLNMGESAFVHPYTSLYKVSEPVKFLSLFPLTISVADIKAVLPKPILTEGDDGGYSSVVVLDNSIVTAAGYENEQQYLLMIDGMIVGACSFTAGRFDLPNSMYPDSNISIPSPGLYLADLSFATIEEINLSWTGGIKKIDEKYLPILEDTSNITVSFPTGDVIDKDIAKINFLTDGLSENFISKLYKVSEPINFNSMVPLTMTLSIEVEGDTQEVSTTLPTPSVIPGVYPDPDSYMSIDETDTLAATLSPDGSSYTILMFPEGRSSGNGAIIGACNFTSGTYSPEGLFNLVTIDLPSPGLYLADASEIITALGSGFENVSPNFKLSWKGSPKISKEYLPYNVVQETGTSETNVMSQKAVTNAIKDALSDYVRLEENESGGLTLTIGGE